MKTIQQIHEELGDVYETIQAFKEQYPAYQKPPRKPILVKDATSKAHYLYAKELEVHEALLQKYSIENSKNNIIRLELDEQLENFIKEEAGLHTVPEKSRDKVWYKAWEDGHSSGYYSVYQHLEELVELFN